MYTNTVHSDDIQSHSWHAGCMTSLGSNHGSNGMPSGTAMARALRRQRSTRPLQQGLAGVADAADATVGFTVPASNASPLRPSTLRPANMPAIVGYSNSKRALVGHTSVGLPTGVKSATLSAGNTTVASVESGIFSASSATRNLGRVGKEEQPGDTTRHDDNMILSSSQSSISSLDSGATSSSDSSSDSSIGSRTTNGKSTRTTRPRKAKKFLGVLGGMGPLATADFLSKLAANTTAGKDQQHVPVLLYGDCSTPDRTACILGDGPSPLPSLLEGIDFLNQAPSVGAICIPCNSAHCWYEEMAAASDVPVFHIVKASAEQVRKKKPDCQSVGVLSTQGTHQMGMYRKTLGNMGFNVVCPTDDEFERLISPAIHMIKTNQMEEAEVLFAEATALLEARGAEIVILGCTEIPVGMQTQYEANPEKFVDSNEALALSVAEFFGKF